MSTIAVNIDLGNLWDILSAIGTIAAAVIALWLALDERKRKITGAFVWDGGTQFCPQLMLCNSGKKAIVINCVDFVYLKKSYKGDDFSANSKYDKFRILLPNEAKTIPLGMPKELHDDLDKIKARHTGGINSSEKYKKIARKPRLFIVKVTDTTGKRFRIKLKFSQSELIENCWGNSLLGDDQK